MNKTLLLLALAPLTAWGQVYKCTDEQGRTTYSQRPCGANAAELEIQTRPPTDYTPGLSDAEQQRLRQLQQNLRAARESPGGRENRQGRPGRGEMP